MPRSNLLRQVSTTNGLARVFATASALTLVLLLGACASSPPPPEPPLRAKAREVEADGIRQFRQGDYMAAEKSFKRALQWQSSLDDPSAVARNQLHMAHVAMARGASQAALDLSANLTDPTWQLDALVLHSQAALALAQVAIARDSVDAAALRCGANCPQRGAVLLLQARLNMQSARSDDRALALQQAQQALALFKTQDDAVEAANSWRLIASADLALGQDSAALAAAQSALVLDRQQALPEKIARDWLFIGKLQQHTDPEQAPLSLQRAISVAHAAGLIDMENSAKAALAPPGP